MFGALLIAGILWLSSGGLFQKKFDLYVAVEEESVAGLNVNAPVKYNGVDVGKVQKIELDVHNPDRVILLFAIEQQTPVREDTVAVLKTQGLTGIAFVELSNTTHKSVLLRATAGNPYPVIRTIPSLSARLENILTTVLASLDQTSKHINAILSVQNQQNLTSTLTDVAAITHTVALRNTNLDHSLRNADITLRNTARLSEQARPVIDQIGRSADAITAMGNDVSHASVSAGKSLNSLSVGLMDFTDVSMPALDQLIKQLTAMSVSMKRLSEQTERNPDSLLFGITPAADDVHEKNPAESKP